jgi:hypothetical protein
VAVVPAAPTPFIDWTLLGQIALISIVAGVGLVAAFSLGLAAMSMARNMERTRWSRGVAGVVAVVMAAAIVAALLWGLYLIVKKS